MIRIRGTLLPEHILLNVTAKSREEAIQQLAESLRSDTRISDWQSFLGALRKCEASGKVNLHYGLTLPHVRTSAVTKMLMAFGRLAHPLQEKDGPVQFVVLVGIPRAMDAEYLRLVGTLMRVFRNEKLRQKVLHAENPADIINIFEKGDTGIDRDE
jgi:mannitol/fructose-specific phosphotransferase system IIA component (Ntr-type)